MFYTEILPKSSSSPARLGGRSIACPARWTARPLANARLLVSELVTNAVEHVREDGEIELHVDLREAVLRVEVVDPGPGFAPAPAGRGARKDSGWGLHFVSRLADRWAVERDGRGRVWFELGSA